MIFNAGEHNATMGFPLIPSGDQPAALVGHEIKPTKDGQGKYLKATFEILDGPYKGRKLWHNFTRENKNPDAVRMGNEQLACLCVATGKTKLNAWEELYGIPIVLSLGAKKRADTGELENVIKNFKSPEAARAAALSKPQAATTASAAPAATVGKPKVAPWKKPKGTAAAETPTAAAQEPAAQPAPEETPATE